MTLLLLENTNSSDPSKLEVDVGESFYLNCSHGNTSINGSNDHVQWFKDEVDVGLKSHRFVIGSLIHS